MDTRPRNDPATVHRIRGAHRDGAGNVIGGYTADGIPFGTKVLGTSPEDVDSIGKQPNPLGGGLSRWYALNPNPKPKGFYAEEGMPKARPKKAKLSEFTQRFIEAAWPKKTPPVPSPVPLSKAAPSREDLFSWPGTRRPEKAKLSDFNKRFIEAAWPKKTSPAPSPVPLSKAGPSREDLFGWPGTKRPKSGIGVHKPTR